MIKALRLRQISGSREKKIGRQFKTLLYQYSARPLLSKNVLTQDFDKRNEIKKILSDTDESQGYFYILKCLAQVRHLKKRFRILNSFNISLLG